ncbi:hypothetical protein [Candidatus Neptunichlamydia sp. REUL1]|uniref:hypothetical protein n=1 Tax=Candidatus Neptunichlamydia sp. REUL1 TaxID=3064277 RepID=UPI0029309DE6|nr:hypothetical protein [Candidatus Neptunochlamydia sp. REUL1]
MQKLTHLRVPPPSSPSASSTSSDHSCGYSSASSSPENSPPARHLPLRLPEAKYQELFDSIDPWHPNPEQRLSANTQHMKTLQTTINRKIQESYFFVLGKQQEDERFQKIFVDFFREIRGVNNLAKEASILLADHFRGYADVSEKVEYTIDAGDFSDIHCTYHQPTEEVILELKKILEEEYGLKGQLIKSLNKAGQKIGDVFQLDTHDTCLREFSIFPRLFPKCMKALKEIFSSLLVSEWLKKDIEEVKIYLKQYPSKESIERPRLTKEDLTRAIALWTAAKHYAEQQKIRDHQLSNKHRNELKDDLCSALISGGLSFITGDPSLVIGQAAKTAMNSFGNTIDPEGKDQAVQVLKLFGGFGLGSAMGRNSWDLGTALGVDLLDLATRAEKTGKGESALRNLGGSVLKGALTQDKKKLVCQVLGFSVAEAVNQLPETDETTPLDIRIARALISNGDVQSHYIKQYVDQKFKEAPKPKVGGELTPEEQEKYPKQEPTLADLQQQEDSKQHALKIQAAQNELIQKEAGVAEANKYLNEKFAKYQKACGAFNSATKELSKVIKGNENLSKAIEERDDAQKTLDSLQGIERIPVPESKPEKPKKPKTVVGKAWNWIKENVAVSGEISATKMPLYTTNPSTSSDRYVPRELSQAPPSPNRPQIREPNAGQWKNVQAMQQGQLFNKNMQYQTPVVDNSPKAPLNYQAYWGQGLANNVQVPPMELRSLGRSNPVDIRPAHNRPLQMAGFVPFVISKVVPEQTQRNVETWVKGYVQQWKENPLRAKRDADICLLIGAKKTIVFAIQAFEQPSLKTKPHTFGLMEVSNRLDNWVAKKVNLDLGSPNAQMSMFVGEIAVPLPLLGGCKPCMKVGQEAFAFMRQSTKLLKPNPLLDRALLNSRGFGKQVRAIEALQNPAYHSGIGNPWSEMLPIYPKGFFKKSITKVEYKALEAAKGVNRSNNYQFVTWVEKGETKAVSIGEMSHSGTFHDRGGLSQAGRALQKKTDRLGSVFPKPSGNIHEVNMHGQKVLDEILNHPDKVIIRDTAKKRYGTVFDIRVGNEKGKGVRFTTEGKFIGFLEPKK